MLCSHTCRRFEICSFLYYNIPQNCFMEALNFSLLCVSLTFDIKKEKHLTDSKRAESVHQLERYNLIKKLESKFSSFYYACGFINCSLSYTINQEVSPFFYLLDLFIINRLKTSKNILLPHPYPDKAVKASKGSASVEMTLLRSPLKNRIFQSRFDAGYRTLGAGALG